MNLAVSSSYLILVNLQAGVDLEEEGAKFYTWLHIDFPNSALLKINLLKIRFVLLKENVNSLNLF